MNPLDPASDYDRANKPRDPGGKDIYHAGIPAEVDDAYAASATFDQHYPNEYDGRGTPHETPSRFTYPAIRGEGGRLADD